MNRAVATDEVVGAGTPRESRRTETSPQIAFATWGRADGIPLVLLHSLAVDQSTWGPVIAQLEGSYRLVTLDTRGHGKSESSTESGPEQWVVDVVAVLDALTISRAVLVGVSMGGIQAIATAAAVPDRVAGIVVADSFAVLPEAISAARIEDMTSYAASHSMDDVARTYIEATLRAAAVSPAAELVHTAMAAMSREDYTTAVAAVFSADVSPALPRITAPTLVLWGEHDAKTPRALSESIVGGIAGADLGTIPGAAHLSHLDQPGPFAQLVTDFVRNLPQF